MKKPLEIVDLVTFTEQLLNEKIHFLCTKFIWLGSNIVDIKVIWFEHSVGSQKMFLSIFYWTKWHLWNNSNYFTRSNLTYYYKMSEFTEVGFHWRHTFRCETIFGNWKHFKYDGKCFLFHLKSSFRSQDI